MIYAVNSAKREQYEWLQRNYIDALPNPIAPAGGPKARPNSYHEIGLFAICKPSTMMNHQMPFVYWSMEHRSRLQRFMDGESREVTMTLRAGKAFHKDGYRHSGRLIALALGYELLRRCRPDLPVTWKSTDTALNFTEQWGFENAGPMSIAPPSGAASPSSMVVARSVDSALTTMRDNACAAAPGGGIRTLHDALEIVRSPRHFLNGTDLPAPADPAYYRGMASRESNPGPLLS